MIEYLFRNLQQPDLHLNHYGIEQCSTGHYHGPAVRDHYLIHYILEGSGIFVVGNHTYTLHKGEGFLICPGVITYYEADKDDPWKYGWVGFHGLQAESYLSQAGLSESYPTFRYDRDDQLVEYLESMSAINAVNTARDMRLTGFLYIILSLIVECAREPEESILVSKANRKEAYIRKVLDFIEMNYSRKFTITQISDFIGLDRSYLCSIFKEYIHSSIQEYLIQYRMNKACELMSNQQLSIGDISRSVGYDDPLLFSKMFKKIKGSSPKVYRNNLRL
ncbi:AraC family transcriptional regulator [Paenibacillus crassostreae]|uniref:AraC family transcriptional regulator n=1 Tax=Paenibacillus crassostreae TaxID=1763538 RepID=A0A167FFH5_9BACL|nr:AraC family transcriptional regulator [Paenibacillus crassostreae]AOZ94458.1 AraC family transcriptional regulator [Paenibacillus crassostreae]OAB76504.1 AraC family transcriptional regulator [Paenibacillus crassostreae]